MGGGDPLNVLTFPVNIISTLISHFDIISVECVRLLAKAMSFCTIILKKCKILTKHVVWIVFNSVNLTLKRGVCSTNEFLHC